MMSEGQRSAQRVAGATDFKDIKALLPLMNDVDIISFLRHLSVFWSLTRLTGRCGQNCSQVSCLRKHLGRMLVLVLMKRNRMKL